MKRSNDFLLNTIDHWLRRTKDQNKDNEIMFSLLAFTHGSASSVVLFVAICAAILLAIITAILAARPNSTSGVDSLFALCLYRPHLCRRRGIGPCASNATVNWWRIDRIAR